MMLPSAKAAADASILYLYPREVSPSMMESIVEECPVMEQESDAPVTYDSYDIVSLGGQRGDQINDRYRAIVENSMDNIYICEVGTGKIIESNSSMRELLGYSDDEMDELTVFDFIDHPRYNIEGYIRLIQEKGHLRIRNRRYRRKDGSLVDIEATCSLLKEDDRTLLCVVSRDMTEILEHERMLVEERNRAEFYLDVLSHDIGNLHQGILGFVKMCKKYDGDQNRSRSCIDNIDILTMRSVHIVNNLKVLSRIEDEQADMVGLYPEPLIRTCINMVKTSIPSKEPSFVIDIPKKRILADPNIKYAFYNIIHNAVKYQVAERPEVRISARESLDGYLRFSIKDHGRGIPFSLRSEIFKREQLNKKHGGLGLSVAGSLVQRSRGMIWIENLDDPGGTVVVIKLPMIR